MTQKQADEIAKLFIVSPLLLGDVYNAENLNEKDNEKVRVAIEKIAMKLLGQTKVGHTITSDFEAVNCVMKTK